MNKVKKKANNENTWGWSGKTRKEIEKIIRELRKEWSKHDFRN